MEQSLPFYIYGNSEHRLFASVSPTFVCPSDRHFSYTATVPLQLWVYNGNFDDTAVVTGQDLFVEIQCGDNCPPRPSV